MSVGMEGRKLKLLREAMERYADELFSLALYATGSREEALALTQDALLSLLASGELELPDEERRLRCLRKLAQLIAKVKGADAPYLIELVRQGHEVPPQREAVLKALLRLPPRERVWMLIREWLGERVEGEIPSSRWEGAYRKLAQAFAKALRGKGQ